ncbi:alpha/beta hydrolase family esterase [Aureliella helgolandensis]|uniref:Dienelactone hydrolase family protein n=1 Tax=Aureliella helgolandensis TaxID=2527968 RepID=A0A518G998_9BACT|nr:dienelactone hydrolase family protein [Aureliella helgolandensis]QDV25175.1 Dienelactone hydrolase family protein [Aureliella helgolandensis]
MIKQLFASAVLLLSIGVSHTSAQESFSVPVASTASERTWEVEGKQRKAIVYTPAEATTHPTPLVFVFHGHGGTMGRAMKSFSLDRLWPEAIVVCPQGLNTPGFLTDPQGKKPGWQGMTGQQEDRDLKFFDEMLSSLKQDYKVDETRVYATGHSNGAAFTYLLWATRGNVLAAVAPSAGAIRPQIRRIIAPKPAMILAGENDTLVKFTWQTATIEFVRKLNKCKEPPITEGLLHSYSSSINAPLQTYIHPGGHQFAADSVPAIVAFFQQHQLTQQKSESE